MDTTIKAAAWALLPIAALLLAGCSGGSGSGGGGPSGPAGANTLTGTLAIISHSPTDGATEVATDTTVGVIVDGAVVADCLQNSGTGMWTASGQSVAGTAALQPDGRGVVFTPATALQPATDYVFRLSPLTCDSSGRITDRPLAVHFRTVDTTAPTLASASISQGQTGVARRPTLSLSFDEPITPDSAVAGVRLTEPGGASVPIVVAPRGPQIDVTPIVDLRGGARHRLTVVAGAGGLTDLSGNPLTGQVDLDFTTAADSVSPSLVQVLPTSAAALSTTPTITLEFDESLDATSIGAKSVTLMDASGAVELLDVTLGADQRAVHIRPQDPLRTNAQYTLFLTTGRGGPTDRSGNPLGPIPAVRLRTGTGATPLHVTSSSPSATSSAVATFSAPRVRFNQPLDANRLGRRLAVLRHGSVEIPCQLSTADLDYELVLTPNNALAPDTSFELTVYSGADGAHGVSADGLAADITVQFDTVSGVTAPSVILAPVHGHASVPTDARIVAVFDRPMDPATLHGGTILVANDNGLPLPGQIVVTHDDRVVRFTPAGSLAASQTYTVTITGGHRGVLDRNGTPMLADRQSRFRTSTAPDGSPPQGVVTLNATETLRAQFMTVPPSGFSIDLDAFDPERAVDPSTFEIVLRGPGLVPNSTRISSGAEITNNTLRFVMPTELALEPGDYQLWATVDDLGGNRSRTDSIAFQVQPPDGGIPFERTQVVWIRFDLDRDGNGRADFDDDMIRLGLNTEGDPAGTNARMTRLMQDAVVAQAHALLGRDANGDPLHADAVPMRLTAERPLGIAFAEMACGGFDPEGPGNRNYGDSSSGTLGRAYFDYRNGDYSDRNTAMRPGLGVFPAELFLFEGRIHQQVYPSFLTSFARGFLPLAPDMGGTPAGAHSVDATVLAPTFDPATGSGTQVARYNAVFSAGDDWATAIGTILAHEIGHSVGLVAEGDNPRGLHGDQSLHNAFSTATDVMASSVGYDALIALPYSFRDLNLAYLRQRLLMK